MNYWYSNPRLAVKEQQWNSHLVASNSELKQLQIGRKRNNMSLAIKDVHRFNRKISAKRYKPSS